MVGSGNHQKHFIQKACLKRAAQPFDFARIQPLLKLRVQLRRHHPHTRTRLQQALGLARRHMACTRQQHGAAFQIGVNRVVVHECALMIIVDWHLS